MQRRVPGVRRLFGGLCAAHALARSLSSRSPSHAAFVQSSAHRLSPSCCRRLAFNRLGVVPLLG